MPLYEYQCKKCHSLTERIQKFSDEPLTVCPHCGGEMEQLLSAPAVQFKGSGWYVTDYAKRASNSGSPSGNGSTSAPSSESKNEATKTETPSSKDTTSRNTSSKDTSGSEK
ncbi:MAG TPA: FmdB family zinc ribbon protein [Terriglobales bacterium]|nr:FmdB family zinc ribbon protein [Terriglobales bacterium]